jgi:hypothetical protein
MAYRNFRYILDDYFSITKVSRSRYEELELEQSVIRNKFPSIRFSKNGGLIIAFNHIYGFFQLFITVYTNEDNIRHIPFDDPIKSYDDILIIFDNAYRSFIKYSIYVSDNYL